MDTIFNDGKIAFGYMTRQEILERGFKDTGGKYGERVIYAKGESRIAHNPSDGWFTRYHMKGDLQNSNA